MSEVQLSDEEKYFIVLGVAENFRADGRGRLDYRCQEIEADVVTNAHGSVRLRLAETDVIVAAKVELGVPDEGAPDVGKIDFLVDCSPLASPDFEGRGGEHLAELIMTILRSSYSTSGAIDLKSLSIVSGQHCYVIWIDILVLQCGGNLIDVMSMGVKLALGVCEIPVVTGLRFDAGEPAPVFTTDEFEFVYLDVRNAPVVITLPRVGRHFVIDATSEEESCSKGKLAIGVTPQGTVTSVDKIGKGCYHILSLSSAISLAEKVGKGLNAAVEDKISQIRKGKPQAKLPDFPESYLIKRTYKELKSDEKLSMFENPVHSMRKF